MRTGTNGLEKNNTTLGQQPRTGPERKCSRKTAAFIGSPGFSGQGGLPSRQEGETGGTKEKKSGTSDGVGFSASLLSHLRPYRKAVVLCWGGTGWPQE